VPGATIGYTGYVAGQLHFSVNIRPAA